MWEETIAAARARADAIESEASTMVTMAKLATVLGDIVTRDGAAHADSEENLRERFGLSEMLAEDVDFEEVEKLLHRILRSGVAIGERVVRTQGARWEADRKKHLERAAALRTEAASLEQMAKAVATESTTP